MIGWRGKDELAMIGRHGKAGVPAPPFLPLHRGRRWRTQKNAVIINRPGEAGAVLRTPS